MTAVVEIIGGSVKGWKTTLHDRQFGYSGWKFSREEIKKEITEQCEVSGKASPDKFEFVEYETIRS